MIEQHHQFNEHEFELTLGDSEGKGSLMCYTGSKRVRDDLATKQQWSVRYYSVYTVWEKYNDNLTYIYVIIYI